MKIQNLDPKILHQLKNIEKSLILTPSSDFFPLVADISSDAIIYNHNPSFLVEIEIKELESSEFWNFIKLFYKLNLIKIAKWWQSFYPNVATTGFFQSMGWSNNYKTLNEWNEWKTFGENSIRLLEEYDFPISVIRLWDRFDILIHESWLKILKIFKIKKNLLKDIISDLYDLPENVQHEITNQCLDLANKFLEKNLKIFPQEEMKELIKQKRYPLSYERKKESYYYKKKVENIIDLKNFTIDIPEDLESDPVVIKFFFRSSEEFENLVHKIREKDMNKIINSIKELLKNIYEN